MGIYKNINCTNGRIEQFSEIGVFSIVQFYRKILSMQARAIAIKILRPIFIQEHDKFFAGYYNKRHL